MAPPAPPGTTPLQYVHCAYCTLYSLQYKCVESKEKGKEHLNLTISIMHIVYVQYEVFRRFCLDNIDHNTYTLAKTELLCAKNAGA